MVLWRPALNWNGGGDVFTAARALCTPHGIAHVQRAGMQRNTKHGVFHLPGTDARVGYRVALTARITRPDAMERVEKVEQQAARGSRAYCRRFGPEGAWTLPPC